MARRTLYPTLPGESAVDRLLNQTLPQLVKDRQASAERAQQRQDTLDARKQSQENFETNFTYVTEQDRLKEDNRKDEKISSHFSKATSYSLTGNDEEAETEYQQGLFWAKKYGRNASDFGSETSRIKIDKVRGINDTYENNFTVFNSLNPTKDQVTAANRNILNIYNDLTDSQKAEYRFKIKSNENDEAFVGIQMQERELEFFAFNSKLYDQTLGKKAGFDSLPESQKVEIEEDIPDNVNGVDYRFDKPGDAKYTAQRKAILQQLYEASGLYQPEKELANKYVTDTVNQYGSWESLSQEINGMSEFNRDLHIERLGIGLIKSGKAKDDREVESYLLEKGVSQETLDASEMFQEGGDDGSDEAVVESVNLDNFTELSPTEKIKVLDDKEVPLVSTKMEFVLNAKKEYDKLILKRSQGTTLNDEERDSLKKNRTIIDSVPSQVFNTKTGQYPIKSKVRTKQLRSHLKKVKDMTSRIRQLETAIEENKTFSRGANSFLVVPGQSKGIATTQKTLKGYQKELSFLKKELEKSPKRTAILEKRLEQVIKGRDKLKDYDLIDVKNENGKIINQFLRKK